MTATGGAVPAPRREMATGARPKTKERRQAGANFNAAGESSRRATRTVGPLTSTDVDTRGESMNCRRSVAWVGTLSAPIIRPHHLSAHRRTPRSLTVSLSHLRLISTEGRPV